MENEVKYLPQYRRSVYIDGHTYQLSLRFHNGAQQRDYEIPHNHAQYEIHTIFQGQVGLELEGTPPLTLQAGDCYLIPPLLYHLRKLRDNDAHCCTLTIDYPKGAPLQHCKIGHGHLSCGPTAIGYLRTLEEELATQQIGADSSIQSLFTLLLITILREVVLPAQHSASAKTVPAHRDERIDNYFARRYGQDISAQELAEHIGVTTRQLARIMQKRYGCTFRQHLLETRLYHARQHLLTTDASISQIAIASGFSCQGAFATAFRKQVGCTPTQYRQQKGRLG